MNDNALHAHYQQAPNEHNLFYSMVYETKCDQGEHER